MIFFVNSCTDAAFNLALEEIIAEKADFEAVMLWRNASAVIVGRNQNTAAEIDADFVRQNNIQVIRRITGGGAVYHDLGNINYTIVAPGRQTDEAAFARNAGFVTELLAQLGVEAHFSGRNDILVGDRKVSGSAKSVLLNKTLFHGTLLFDTDINVLSKVLTPSANKIASKGIKSVRSRVANLKEFIPEMDKEQFWQTLQKLTSNYLQTVATPIPEEFIAEAEQLAESKYRKWDWNYGSVIKYAYNSRKKFSCGEVEIKFNVINNKIADFCINGDFFGDSPIGILEKQFNDLCPQYEIIAQKIPEMNLNEFISGIKDEEFLQLFDL